MNNKVSIFKALADKSRLEIVNFLLIKRSYVDEISRGLNLSPSTVSFHLKKLEEAGLVSKQKEQYYTIFSLREEILNSRLRELVFVKEQQKTIDQSGESRFISKVINTFTDGGIITRLPAQYKKRLIMLDYVSRKFKKGEILKEQEVDARISQLYFDHCTIRRMFIDEGYMSRENNIYTVKKTGVMPEIEQPENEPVKVSGLSPQRKRELKKEYAQKPPEAGAFMLKNNVTNKRYIGTSVNLPGIMNRYTFLLTLGKHDNKDLQSDWNNYGKNSFEFTVLEQIKTEPDDNRLTLKSKLESLEEKWHTLLIGDKTQFYNQKIKIAKKDKSSDE